MRQDVTVFHLQMLRRDHLVPGRSAPEVAMRRLGRDETALAQQLLQAVATPYGWGHLAWDEQEWARWRELPRNRYAYVVEDEVAGFVELHEEPAGEVELGIFGLLPAFHGRGLGGHALTLAIDECWGLRLSGGAAVRRVWLTTNSRDDPHALPNYRARGFTVFRTEQQIREIRADLVRPSRTPRAAPDTTA